MRTQLSSKRIILVALAVCLLVGVSLQKKKYTLQKVLDAINEARTDPKGFEKWFREEWWNKLSTKKGRCGLPHLGYRLNEVCPVQFDSLWNFYKTQQPLKALKLSKGLTAGAYEHARYLATELHYITHRRKGQNLFKRYRVYTKKPIGGVAENILGSSYGPLTEKHNIGRFILDDGVRNRGHRKNLYSGYYGAVGIGIHEDTIKKHTFVVVLGFSKHHDCSQCDKVPADVSKKMGWDQYIAGPEDQNSGGIINATGGNTTDGKSALLISLRTSFLFLMLGLFFYTSF